MPNQYDNDANFSSYYENTGSEVWRQTRWNHIYFVTCCGIGGTITATGMFLKEHNKIRVIAVQAQRNHPLQGLRNFEESLFELFKRHLRVVDKCV